MLNHHHIAVQSSKVTNKVDKTLIKEKEIRNFVQLPFMGGTPRKFNAFKLRYQRFTITSATYRFAHNTIGLQENFIITCKVE